MGKKNRWCGVNCYIGEDEGFTSYPKEPGNYAIYLVKLKGGEILKKKLMYFGTSVNLKFRLSTHEVKNVLWAIMDDLDYNYILIKCKIFKDAKQRKLIEKKFIRRLNPKINALQ